MKKNHLLLTMLLLSPFFLFATDLEKGYIYELDKTFQMSKTGTLDMKTGDADIVITGANRDDIHIKVFREVHIKGASISDENEFSISVTSVNGDIIVREHNSNYNIGFFSSIEETYKITIELPLNAGLKLKGDDDDYRIRNVNGQIFMDVDDGDIMLSDCKGELMDLTVEDGDIDIEGARGHLTAELDDGDLYAKNCDFNSVDLRCNDGELKIETTVNNGGDYNFRTDDGDVVLNVKDGGGSFEIKHDDGHVRATSRFQQEFESEYKHKFSLQGGNAFVYIRTNDGNVSLNSY